MSFPVGFFEALANPTCSANWKWKKAPTLWEWLTVSYGRHGYTWPRYIHVYPFVYIYICVCVYIYISIYMDSLPSKKADVHWFSLASCYQLSEGNWIQSTVTPELQAKKPLSWPTHARPHHLPDAPAPAPTRNAKENIPNLRPVNWGVKICLFQISFQKFYVDTAQHKSI